MTDPNPAQRDWHQANHEATHTLDARYGTAHRPAYAKTGNGWTSDLRPRPRRTPRRTTHPRPHTTRTPSRKDRTMWDLFAHIILLPMLGLLMVGAGIELWERRR